MRNWFCAIALTLSLGCASARVRPYIGQQQAWPTASGSIVNMKYDYPVFTSLPPAPYEVLGELRIESALYEHPEEGHMPLLIKKAKKIGADAVVFVTGDIFFSTNYGPAVGDAASTAAGAAPTLTQVNKFNPDSFEPGVAILAIRWVGEPPEGLPKYHQEEAPATATTEEMPAAEAAPAETPAEVATEPVTLPPEEAAQPPAAEEAPAPSEPAAEQPPAEQPPAETPPQAEQPPAEAPPAEQPPAEQPPAAQPPPAEQPPTQ